MRIVDLHEDFGIASSSQNVFTDTLQSSIRTLKRHGDVLVFSAIFAFRKSLNRMRPSEVFRHQGGGLSQIPDHGAIFRQAGFYSYLRLNGIMDFVRNREDLNRGGTQFLISMEGADALPDPSDIYMLHDLGVRCMGLTWNYDNKYAASCYSKKDYGLTGSGEELVNLCNQLGIVVDTAHTSRQTTIDVCSISKKPVIMSHTNVRAIRDHPRNADDAMIEAIRSTGGVVGISGIAEMLSGKASIQNLVENINYIGENFGWDLPAIGSDFLGMRGRTTGFKRFHDIERLGNLLERSDKVMHINAERLLYQVL